MKNLFILLVYVFLILAIAIAGLLPARADDPTIQTTYSPVFTSWTGNIYYTVTDQSGVDHPHEGDYPFQKTKADALAKCYNDETLMQNQGYTIKGPIAIHLAGPAKDKDKDAQAANDGWGRWVTIQCLKDKGYIVQYRLKQVSPGVWQISFANQSNVSLQIEYYLLAASVDKNHLTQFFMTNFGSWQDIMIAANQTRYGTAYTSNPNSPIMSFTVQGQPELFINSAVTFSGSFNSPDPNSVSSILENNNPDTAWSEGAYDDSTPTDGITQ